MPGLRDGETKDQSEEEEMSIRIRFFARFRELLGTDIIIEGGKNTTLASIVKSSTQKNKEGYNAIFDEKGNFSEFVILMRNGKRVELTDAETTFVEESDEIAVFPPVAGG
jgi:molybdopterin synthase sulfur carrier subunit